MSFNVSIFHLLEKFIFQCSNIVLVDCFNIASADLSGGGNRLYIFGNACFALLQLQVGCLCSVRPLLSRQKRYNIVNSRYICGGMLPVRVSYFLTPGCWHLPVFALKWQLAVPASLCSFVAGSRWGKKPRSSRHSDS